MYFGAPTARALRAPCRPPPKSLLRSQTRLNTLSPKLDRRPQEQVVTTILTTCLTADQETTILQAFRVLHPRKNLSSRLSTESNLSLGSRKTPIHRRLTKGFKYSSRRCKIPFYRSAYGPQVPQEIRSCKWFFDLKLRKALGNMFPDKVSSGQISARLRKNRCH